MNFFSILITCFILSTSAMANYLSVGESGETLDVGHYRLGASLQSLSAGKGGLNAGAFVDTGWKEDLSSRFLFGVGSVDFHVGASLKYIPFPDFQNQPAIGLKTSFWLARLNDTSTTTLQIAPLFSKKVNIEKGQLTPYISVPINLTSIRSSTETGTQFVVGSEYTHPELENVFFSGEIVLNLKNSESGITVFCSIPFDASKGFKKKQSKQ